MPDIEPRHSPDRPWENGWAPDTSRAHGTRRLWLAGMLAIATVAACVTAIAVGDRPADDTSGGAHQRTSLAGARSGPGLISFPSPTGTPGASPAHPSASPAPSSGAPAASPSGDAAPASATAPPASSAPAPAPDPGRSVQSVNYPDRYWHLNGGGLVGLDPVASVFQPVKGLADASCYSFTTADGGYLRHRDFVLRAEHDDGSGLFAQDATFCPRPSRGYAGAVVLESVNYPGRFLRHQNFQLKLDRYQDTALYRADSSFRVVAAAG